MQLTWVTVVISFLWCQLQLLPHFRHVSKVQLLEQRKDALKVIHRTFFLCLSRLALSHPKDLKKFLIFFSPSCKLDPKTSLSSLLSFDKNNPAFLKILEARQVSPPPDPFVKVLMCEDLRERPLLEVTFPAAAWQVIAAALKRMWKPS